MRSNVFAFVLVAVALTGCSRGPVISVTNRSAITVSNAVVSGPSFSQPIGTLASGAERRVTVHPRGESDVRLTFEANGQKIDSGAMEYFEDNSSYRVSLTVGADLKVTSSTSIRPY